MFLAAMLGGLCAHAQVEVPAEFVERIKSLTPSQQLALAERYDIDLTQLLAFAGTSEVSPARDVSQAAPVTLKQRVSVNQEKSDPDTAIVAAPSDPRGKMQPEVPERSPSSVASLRRFGAEIFNRDISSFTVIDNLPVADDYIVGAGDEINIQFIGKEEKLVRVAVQRDNTIVVPKFGQVDVAGLTFSEVKELINQMTSQMLIGVQSVVSLGPRRGITVFAAGEVQSPGNYVVSNSTTALQLLFFVGGPTEVGSFRRVEIKRRGVVVATLDLYDLLMRGTLEDDLRLQSGDVLFVPPTRLTVGVRGEVVRSARFELLPGETIADLLEMAGGLTVNALPAPVTLQTRKPGSELPILENVDLTDSLHLSIELVDGDLVTVSKLPSRFNNPITISGEVDHPGVFGWFDGVRVSDFISNLDTRLTSSADLDVALIVSRRKDRLTVDVREFSLREALMDKGSESDPILHAHDELIVLSRTQPRAGAMSALVAQLESQATFLERPRIVQIKGAVGSAGKYPLIPGQTVSDIIRLAGGAAFLNLDVDMDIGLIVRRSARLVGKLKVVPFRLHAALEQRHSPADPLLAPMDELLILNESEGTELSNRRELLQPVIEKLERQATLDSNAQIVSVLGKVREPGDYPILDTFDLEYLIELAGGFAEGAYTKSAEIRRMTVSAEQKSGTEIIDVSLQRSNDLKLRLQSRDVLRVNQMPGWRRPERVNIEGEVLFPGTYALVPGERISDLLQRAGGLSSSGFAQGAVYTNRLAKEQQLQQVRRYIHQLDKQTTSARVSGLEQESDLQGLSETVENDLAGRVTIDLQGILSGSTDGDPLLQDGDRLYIPRESYQVAVVGEVFEPGSFVFTEGFDAQQYIELAGDVTRFADSNRSYLIKANGEVVPLKRKGFFRKRADLEIAAGDTVVVPLNLDYAKPLDRIQKFSSVAFQSLTSIAALLNISKL